LKRAQAVVTPFNLPVMIHMGQQVSSMARVLALLKPGDVAHPAGASGWFLHSRHITPKQ